jgi:hypothetical protein
MTRPSIKLKRERKQAFNIANNVLFVVIKINGPKPVLGPTQTPTHRVPLALSAGVKQSERETEHSSPSCAELKNTWNYDSTPLYDYVACTGAT